MLSTGLRGTATYSGQPKAGTIAPPISQTVNRENESRGLSRVRRTWPAPYCSELANFGNNRRGYGYRAGYAAGNVRAGHVLLTAVGERNYAPLRSRVMGPRSENRRRRTSAINWIPSPSQEDR